MISSYDYVPTQKVIQTYQPLPFDELYNAGLARQKRYDTTMEGVSKTLSDIGETPHHIADEPYYRKIITGLESDIDDVTKKTPDLGSLEGTQAVNSVVRKWKNNSELRLMAANLPKATELEKQVADASANNEKWNYMKPALALESFYDSGSAGTGYLGDYGVTELANPNEWIDKQAKEIPESGFKKGWLSTNNTFHYTKGDKGVLADKIAQVLNVQYIPASYDAKTNKYTPSSVTVLEDPISIMGGTKYSQNLENYGDYQELTEGKYSSKGYQVKKYADYAKTAIEKYAHLDTESDINITDEYSRQAKKADDNASSLITLQQNASNRIKENLREKQIGVIANTSGANEGVLSGILDVIGNPFASAISLMSGQNITGSELITSGVSQAIGEKAEKAGVNKQTMYKQLRDKAYNDYNDKWDSGDYLGAIQANIAGLIVGTTQASESGKPTVNITDPAVKNLYKKLEYIHPGFAELGKTESGRKQQLEISNKYMNDWMKEKILPEYESETKPKIVADVNTFLFGNPGKDGTVTFKADDETLSGNAVNITLYETDKSNITQKTLKEIIGDKGVHTMSWVGQYKDDNPYAPGAQSVIIDGQPYAMDGVFSGDGYYMKTKNDPETILKWNLYNYSRDPSDMGKSYDKSDNSGNTWRITPWYDYDSNAWIVTGTKLDEKGNPKTTVVGSYPDEDMSNTTGIINAYNNMISKPISTK